MSDTPPSPGDLGFDPEAIRKRYVQEQEKRSGPKTKQQLVATSSAVSADDPFAEPVEREPLFDEVDVVVVGGGFTGLITGAHMRKAGVPLIRMIEKGGGFGGVWYWNRYPGIRCDVDSYIYLPLLEDVPTVPSEKFAEGGEIRAHCRAIADTFDLDEAACLQTQVTGMRWDEDSSRWSITTDRGDDMRARFVCLGSGVLDRPKIPDVPGLDEFQGHVFHSSRWDYDYTGGDAHGNLVNLKDKKVAVVGTAASAIQFVPHLAEFAEQLTVFQRTPSIVSPRGNQATDRDWYDNQPAGWQTERMENFTAVIQSPPWLKPPERDLVADTTTTLFTAMRNPPADLAEKLRDSPRPTQMLMANYERMERLRASIDAVVDDPDTAEALKPYYNLGCKRPQFSDTYLTAFNRPSVTLVNTEGGGIERLTPNGIVYDGVEYEADCIIFATGFAAALGPARAGEFPITGRDGQLLSEHWSDGVRSLHGMLTAGFPNLFVVGGIAQAALTINFSHILTEQAAHAAAIIKRCLDEGIASVDVRPEAEERWAEAIAETGAKLPHMDLGCSPDDVQLLLRSAYPGGPLEYIRIVREWRGEGFERDLVLERAE
ncbi:MAG TPA: NAD(P)/FAD-dependent oxidoreductase [Solirubrobacteraceae bacterium]|nr:NAD(P)/FAD-dependent oxidoreductase [Solirubrobacteraceae bacterium]